MEIKLFDKNNLHTLVWPNTVEAERTRLHLEAMVLDGVKSFIQNVETELQLVWVNGKIIPITINQKEYNNSYLTSNYFPIKYLEEQMLKTNSLWRYVKKPLLETVGALLKGIKINKVVIVNNWLLPTNIYPGLTGEELDGVTQFLIRLFPDHMLIFRSLETRTCRNLVESLENLQYKILYARHVCFYDPEQKGEFSPKIHYHHRRDRRLIEDEGYEIIGHAKIESGDIKKILELYNALYLTRHTHYSPQYTEKFLKQALQTHVLEFVCLKKGGEIRGVIGFYEREGKLIAPFCGYQLNTEEASHLYRMLTMLAIDEAEKRGLLLNDGSGGEAPKKYRGMKTFPEYAALYARHLPLFRRGFWQMAEKLAKRFRPTS